MWRHRFGSCIRWLCISRHAGSLSLAHGAVGVLGAHDGLHHFCHTAGLLMCGAVALRHRELARAAVGFSAQLRRLLACSACGMLDVAATYSSYASQRAQLEAPSACMSSCRLQMYSYASFGLAVQAVCWMWPPFTLRVSHSMLSSRHLQLVCAAVSRLQCTATQALGLQCMRRAGRGRRLLFLCLAACSARGPSVGMCSCRLQCIAT